MTELDLRILAMKPLMKFRWNPLFTWDIAWKPIGQSEATELISMRGYRPWPNLTFGFLLRSHWWSFVEIHSYLLEISHGNQRDGLTDWLTDKVNVFTICRGLLLNKLGRPSPKDIKYEIWLKSVHWFWRRRFLKSQIVSPIVQSLWAPFEDNSYTFNTGP